MGLARLVVVDGPDSGREFEIPVRGGGIGRDESNVFQLSDPSVSRSHCMLELRSGKLTLIDGGSRNRTLVNGVPINEHVLQIGDEITVGQTRLAFRPRDDDAASVRPAPPKRVTMEVGSRELFAALTVAVPGPADDRARRHLAALAQLGDGLREVPDRDRLGQSACQAAVSGLSAQRACLFLRDALGRMNLAAASVGPGVAQLDTPSLDRDVIAKVVSEEKAIALEIAGRNAAAAPIYGASASPPGPGEGASYRWAPVGLLYVERGPDERWDHIDVMAASCMAHLLSATLAGLEARETLTHENAALTEKLASGAIVGSSPPTRAILAFVAKVGPSDATVLLTGESGSGKEMVAQAIHRASRRSRGPFIAVNCAALTESLIESELFGHEKGAFTGATDRKLGRFELADKGTLFLDEVGELPPACQTKFLRVLEERVFERVGGGKTIAVDVRVVAATNRDLPHMVQRGLFRDDLYYRLSVIHTVVPPLRERKDDIAELAQHFLSRLSAQVPRRIRGFNQEALTLLTGHSWPGNVRELKNAVERAIVLGEGDVIRAQDLPPNITGRGPIASPAVVAPVYNPSAVFRPTPVPGTPILVDESPPAPAVAAEPGPPRSLREIEKQGIIEALRATGGNKAQAASILEIDRSTLYKKIKDYGIA